MVTIRSLALRLPTGIEHERRTSPLTWTEHEPHCATPQPYLVPVSPTCSRSTQRSGVSASTSRSRTLPFTFSFAISPRSSIVWLLGLDRRVLHLAPQHLANIGLGQFLPELHDLRHLVAGELLARVRDHLLLGERRIAAHDHHAHDFTGMRVRGRDRAHL